MSPEMIGNLFYFQAVTFLPLALGYALRKIRLAKIEWTKPFFSINVVVFQTLVILSVVWVMDFSWESFILPFTFVVYSLAAISVGWLFSKLYRYAPKKRGSYIFGASMSNQLTLGGFICLLLLGVDGYSKAVIYLILGSFIRYSIHFPVARYYGESSDEKGIVKNLLGLFTDIRSLPLLAIGVGVVLNLTGVDSPAPFQRMVGILVPIISAVTMLTIGVTISLSAIRGHISEYFSVSLQKFFILPFIGLGLSYLFNLDDLSRKMIFILSAMPSAINSVVIVNVFNLDRNLINSLFLVTTALLIIFLFPLLALIVSFI